MNEKELLKRGKVININFIKDGRNTFLCTDGSVQLVLIQSGRYKRCALYRPGRITITGTGSYGPKTIGIIKNT